MTEYNEHDDIYLRLMVISQEALESGHYETAYHALEPRCTRPKAG